VLLPQKFARIPGMPPSPGASLDLQVLIRTWRSCYDSIPLIKIAEEAVASDPYSLKQEGLGEKCLSEVFYCKIK
jgi:hypothetical protein